MRELSVGGLHVYDTGGDGPVVYWHHGTPNTGLPPSPLISPGVRWVSHDRPGYGGSEPRPGRSVASAAADVAAVADALSLGRFAVLGHSGGGPHALACAALLPDRVVAAAAGASPAPMFPDWFEGMAPQGAAGFRAALDGRAAKEAFETTPPPADADIGFAPADFKALTGEWGWFIPVVEAARANGPGPAVDDDLAFVADWGFDPGAITAPTLLFTGADDRMVPPGHSRRLAELIPGAELRVFPGEGHVSVLTHGPGVVTWLSERVLAD